MIAALARRFAVACFVALGVAGCGRSDDATVVRFWAMGREAEVVGELIADFERTHPGIRIDLQKLPWTAAHEKLLTAFAGDSLPDLCQLGNTWLPEFAALGALEPLDAYVAKSGVVGASDYFPGIWDTNVVDERLLGVPWYVDTRLLFYRRDLLAAAGFDAPPRTWDEWRRMLAAIKRNAGADKYAVLLPLDEFEPLLGLAIQQSDPLLADHGTRGNFDSAGFRRALAFYVEMFRETWAPPMSDTQIANVWFELGRGFYTFYISGPWNIVEFKKRLPPEALAELRTAPLPGPDGAGVGVGGGTSLVLFAQSKRKAAAWQFVEYLSRREAQLRLHALTGDLPPRRSVWADPQLAGDTLAHAFREQLESVRPAPKVPEWERIANTMQLTAERIVRGGLPFDEGVAALDAQVDAILEKRRWMLARQERKP